MHASQVRAVCRPTATKSQRVSLIGPNLNGCSSTGGTASKLPGSDLLICGILTWSEVRSFRVACDRVDNWYAWHRPPSPRALPRPFVPPLTVIRNSGQSSAQPWQACRMRRRCW